MQPNPWDDGVQTDESPSPSQIANPEQIIIGMPQQMNQQMGQQIMYLQPQSSSPKVLGIFVIIWGAISFLGVFLSFIPVVDPSTGEELIVPNSVILINVFNSILAGFTCVLGGYWMTQYKKKGIHLTLVGILISYFVGLGGVALGGDAGLGELPIDESTAFTLFAVLQGVCSIICGLLVAIPLMSAAQGLDDSSLFGQLK
ncbi:hypothetical protein N9P14_00215 [Candidatus Poseidoniaceae archaeon]|nr:hypothetical protein [Candidatus Poseidoniaceae archaeon]|tara:strand:+ start:211 stop:810 length:600 start_codon:yes stop_codon:yes gene_type:complete